MPISWQTTYDPSHYSSCVCTIAVQGIYISHKAEICNIQLQSDIWQSHSWPYVNVQSSKQTQPIASNCWQPYLVKENQHLKTTEKTYSPSVFLPPPHSNKWKEYCCRARTREVETDQAISVPRGGSMGVCAAHRRGAFLLESALGNFLEQAYSWPQQWWLCSTDLSVS